MPFSWLLISGLILAGSSGVLLRYAIVQVCIASLASTSWANFPVGTWVANMVGCLLAGLVLGLQSDAAWLTPALRTILVVGLLGGLTTYSSFIVECFTMLQAGDWAKCASYTLTSLALGLLLVWAGSKLAAAL